jgi:hypothetical protein
MILVCRANCSSAANEHKSFGLGGVVKNSATRARNYRLSSTS